MRGTHTQFIVTRSKASGRPLFAFPLQICKGVGSTDVKFAKATPDGGKPKQRFADEVTGNIFEPQDIERGVDTDSGFVAISDTQLASIDAEVAIEGVEVLTTVERAEIPVERVRGFYYLQAPADGASHHAYRVVFEALCAQPQQGQGKRPKAPLSLLVRYQSGTRIKVGVVYSDADRGCLVLIDLNYGADVREPDKDVLAPQRAEVDPQEVALARQVIEGLSDPAVSFDTPVDEAIEIKRALVEAVASGERTTEEVAEIEPVEAPAEDALAGVLEDSLAGV